MKATDLMIGDLVMCEGMAEKIRSIGEAGVTLQGYYDKAAILENITPIPLTTEILKKNATSIERSYIFGKYPNTLYVMFDSQANVRILEGDCEYYGIELKYVHELQHALKLYGIEKEIIL